MWDEIIYPFLNFNKKWISNFTPHFTGHVIIYPCQDLSKTTLVKESMLFLSKWDISCQWHLQKRMASIYLHFFEIVIFSCDQAAPWMVQSIRLSVCLSVTPFWLCSHHRIITKFSRVITNDRSDVHAKGQVQAVTEIITLLPYLAFSGL